MKTLDPNNLPKPTFEVLPNGEHEIVKHIKYDGKIVKVVERIAIISFDFNGRKASYEDRYILSIDTVGTYNA